MNTYVVLFRNMFCSGEHLQNSCSNSSLSAKWILVSQNRAGSSKRVGLPPKRCSSRLYKTDKQISRQEIIAFSPVRVSSSNRRSDRSEWRKMACASTSHPSPQLGHFPLPLVQARGRSFVAVSVSTGAPLSFHVQASMPPRRPDEPSL